MDAVIDTSVHRYKATQHLRVCSVYDSINRKSCNISLPEGEYVCKSMAAAQIRKCWNILCFDDSILPDTDLLAMSLPGTPETRNILTRKRIELLAEGACIVNVGRGTAIDEEALADKIYDGKWTTPRQYHEDGSIADW